MSGAHRCKICRLVHYGTAAIISYPPPATIAQLDQFMLPLLEAAAEFTSYGGGTPVEFVQWLSLDTAHAAEMAVKLAARS